MGFGENRFHVYARSKGWYHAILFGSFVLALKAIPFVQEKVALYVSHPYLQPVATYAIVYVFAIYLIPEVGFMLVKSTLEN